MVKRQRSFYEGYQDFFKGKLYDNPYYKGSLFYKEYEAGQNAAYFDNLNQLSETVHD